MVQKSVCQKTPDILVSNIEKYLHKNTCVEQLHKKTPSSIWLLGGCLVEQSGKLKERTLCFN